MSKLLFKIYLVGLYILYLNVKPRLEMNLVVHPRLQRFGITTKYYLKY